MIGHRRAGIPRDNGGVIPLFDFAEIDVTQNLPREPNSVCRRQLRKVVNDNHCPEDSREVERSAGGLVHLFKVQWRVASSEVSCVGKQPIDTLQRTDRLIGEVRLRVYFAVNLCPLREDRIDERRSGAIDRDRSASRRRNDDKRIPNRIVRIFLRCDIASLRCRDYVFLFSTLRKKVDKSNRNETVDVPIFTLLCTGSFSVGLVDDPSLSEAPCYVVFRLFTRRLLKYRWSPVELKKRSE